MFPLMFAQAAPDCKTASRICGTDPSTAWLPARYVSPSGERGREGRGGEKPARGYYHPK